MWRCKGQHYHDGLWPLAEHHMSQTITWYDSLGHYSGSSPLLPALWGICDWAQQRSVHSVKCTYACGGRLSLATRSHYVAEGALRLLSSCLMSTMEISPLCFASCDSTLRQSVEDLWKKQYALCVCTSAVCSAYIHVCGSAYRITCWWGSF